MTQDINSTTNIPIWRDERFWKIAFQVVTLVAVIAVLSILITNLSRNLAQQGRQFGFVFLSNEAGFSIGETLVSYAPQDPYSRVIRAGLVNSIRAIAVAIVFATIVGIVAGVASFSDNWLVHKISRVYVGLVRNVPLLLQLFFWYFAVFFQLPTPQEQINFLGLAIFSKRGVYLPGPSLTDQNWLGLVALITALLLSGLAIKLIRDVRSGGTSALAIARLASRIINGIFALAAVCATLYLVWQGITMLISGEADAGFSLGYGAWIPVLIVGIVVMVMLWNWRTKLMVEQGSSGKPQLMAIAGIGAVLMVIFLAGLGWHTPEVLDTGGATGGLRLSLEYAAAVTGLVFYTGAFIAEIVRAGIQSVSRGQWEAARSLGLQQNMMMRLVVFPQALRVIIPPLNSEYMNLAKNTTLAFAIGYPEVFSVSSTSLNQTGRAVEVILIIMLVYLGLNLLISVSMNQLNALVQFKER